MKKEKHITTKCTNENNINKFDRNILMPECVIKVMALPHTLG